MSSPVIDDLSLSDFITFEEQTLQMAQRHLASLKREASGRMVRNGQLETYPEAIIRVSARIERCKEAIAGYRAALTFERKAQQQAA